MVVVVMYLQIWCRTVEGGWESIQYFQRMLDWSFIHLNQMRLRRVQLLVD